MLCGMGMKTTGVRRRVNGWQVFCRVDGKFYSQFFPDGSDVPLTPFALKNHREALRQRVKKHKTSDPAVESVLLSTPPTSGSSTFASDAIEYLNIVKPLASYSDTERNINFWVDEFRDRGRHTIEGREVQAVLSRLLDEGYAVNTVRNTRSALMGLYTELDGASARNPAKDASKFLDRPEEEDHAIPMDVAEAIIAHVPGVETSARLAVMLWTGLPPKLIAQLKPEDIDLEAKTMKVSARKKGKGVPGRTLPLLPEGVKALRKLLAVGAIGEFSQSTVGHKWKTAAKAEDAAREQKHLRTLGLAQTTPYWLRHSFGTHVALKTGDALAVMQLMMHTNISQTARYMKGAAAARAALAISSMSGKKRGPAHK